MRSWPHLCVLIPRTVKSDTEEGLSRRGPRRHWLRLGDLAYWVEKGIAKGEFDDVIAVRPDNPSWPNHSVSLKFTAWLQSSKATYAIVTGSLPSGGGI